VAGILGTYVYETDKDGTIIGGTLLSVANNELGALRIERQLDKLDLGKPKQGG
jgi:uncharacterized membrane protein